MAKSFSLKDNPIFQRTEVPVPVTSPAPLAEDSLKTSPQSESSTQSSLPKKAPERSQTPVKPTKVRSTKVNITGVNQTQVKSTQVKSTQVEIITNGYLIDNDVSDRLSSLQAPIEQVVYQRLYRLSYGFNRNFCQVSMKDLCRQTNIRSDKTVQKALKGLMSKGHIERIGASNHDPTGGNTYRVYLPKEVFQKSDKTLTGHT